MFVFFAHADREDGLGDQNDHGGGHDRPDADDRQTTQLGCPIGIAEDRQHDDAEHTAHTVDRENVQRIVDVEGVFDHGTQLLTQNAGDAADDQRLNRTGGAGRRCD